MPLRPLHTANPLHQPQPDSYFGLMRKDALDLIKHYDLKADRLVELGCSGGQTGAEIKKLLSPSYYLGVEYNPQAAEVARQSLDHVITADLNTQSPADLGVAENDFDLLIVFDVLEHLYNPWDALAEWTRVLKPGGQAILSIPNTQNIKILGELAEGRFTYTGSGLLDVTHIRFFTGQAMDTLINGAGLKLQAVHWNLDPKPDPANVLETGNVLNWNRLRLSDLSSEELNRFMVWQYFIVAERIA